jgi:peptidoglycan/LPS O-acetylase OafA/YrhL
MKPFIHAVWEPFFALGVILALLWSLHRWLNRPAALASWAARGAFAVYAIHPPILVALARGAQPWQAPPALTTLVIGAAACAVCWATASLLILLPGVRRVL